MNRINILGVNETLYKETLPNGLDIYMVQNTNIKNFYITLNVKFGSLATKYKFMKEDYELPKGVAHFLEHLTFNMPDGNAFEYYSSLGSSVNAYTSYDVTCYEVFANNHFKENLSYLIKYVCTPYFTKEMVNNEKGIILEEIKMYLDQPSFDLIKGSFKNIFINDEHQYLISGTIDDVKKIGLEDILNAYNAFYHPENMFVVITGNFNPEEAVAIISESMKDFHYDEYNKPDIKLLKEPFKVRLEEETKEGYIEKAKANLGIKIPKSVFKSLKLSSVKIKLLFNLIVNANFGSTSTFKEELEINGIINDDLQFMLTDTQDYYVLNIMAITDYPDYLIKKLKDKFDNLRITKEEIDRKIKSTLSNFILMFDNIELVNTEIQDDLLNYDEYLTDIYGIYKSLNIDDAQNLIKVLNKKLYSSYIVCPKKQ